jgi:hypothetical protein
MLPAAAVSVFSLALLQRDGLAALLGYALTTASAGLLVVAAHVVAGVLRHALEAFSIA